MRESEFHRLRMIKASKEGKRLWRNQIGRYELKDGRWITSGLAVGSSDLIGIEPVLIIPKMVGTIIGRFIAEECKIGKSKTTKEQDDFIWLINSFGGRAEVVRG